MPVPPFAQLLVPRTRKRDLTLPAAQAAQIDQILATPAGKRRPVVFAGPARAGKTMAAEVIAAELGLPLYRVDLSKVVSQHIGETEKNLQQVFGAVTRTGAVLFFDEADALFGKRTDVKDSHDKYANQQVDYLLAQLEHFTGLLILASNLKSNIDSAYVRTRSVIVDFAV